MSGRLWSDSDLVLWLAQYDGRSAGYYPGLRRARARARAEADARGLAWWLAQTYDLTALRPEWRRTINPELVLRLAGAL